MHSTSSRTKRAAVALVCATLMAMVAACGSDEPPAPTDEPQSLAELEAAAKAEGALTWYSTIPTESTQAVLDAFMEKYPEIEADFIRAPTGELWQRFSQEFYGQVNSADVMSVSDFSLVEEAKQNGMVQPYVPASILEARDAGLYPDEAIDPDGYWFNLRTLIMSPMYNTTLVPEDMIPTTYTDFLDPFWKGKLGVMDPVREATSPFAYWTWQEKLGLGEDFWSGIGANEPIIFEEGGAFINALVAGEIAGGFGIEYQGWAQIIKGAPIAVVLPDEGVAYNSDFPMLPAKAPHPNAGKLLLHFIGSQEGADLLARVGGYSMVRQDVGSYPEGVGRPDIADIHLIPPDFKAVQEHYQELEEMWNRAVRG